MAPLDTDTAEDQFQATLAAMHADAKRCNARYRRRHGYEGQLGYQNNTPTEQQVALEKRRERVAEMTERGMTKLEIAAVLGCTGDVVRADRALIKARAKADRDAR